MIAYNPEKRDTVVSPGAAKACVLGIGGAGANVIDRIALENMVEIELVSLNTDIRALTSAVAARKVQLGREITRGLGAGGDAELGLQAAGDAEVEIRELLTGREMVLLCAGLGGGTGSGAAPLVARIAREMGVFVVTFATMPFSFEGRRRVDQARQALADLERSSDTLIVFENDAMGKLVVSKSGVQEAFAAADHLVGQCIRAVTALAMQPGLIRIGMDDLKAVLGNVNARCLFGHGVAQGRNRAQEALNRAMKNSLLDGGKAIDRSGSVLVHVMGGPSMTLYEVELLMAELVKRTGAEVRILFGVGVDQKLGEQMSVTVISSIAATSQGFLDEDFVEEVAAEQGTVQEGVTEEEATVCMEGGSDRESSHVSVGESEPEMPAGGEKESSAPEEPVPAQGQEDSTGEQFEMELLCEQLPEEEADENDHGMESAEDVLRDAQPVGCAAEEAPQEEVEGMDGEDEKVSGEQAGVLSQLLPKVFGRRKREQKEAVQEPGESGNIDESAMSEKDSDGALLVEASLRVAGEMADEKAREDCSGDVGLEELSSEEDAEVSVGITEPELAAVSQLQQNSHDEEGDLFAGGEQLPKLDRFADSGNQGALALDEGKAGRFVKGEPTIVGGEDLDVPTFLRRKSVR